MIDDTPLVRPGDRFPIGLPGHAVPLTSERPSEVRPWGMDHAVVPIRSAGKHDKPTSTTNKPKATTFTNDSRELPDPDTITVTD
jgi:hypothetical protein